MSDDNDIMNDMLENADLLNTILHNHLDQHIAKRIEDQKHVTTLPCLGFMITSLVFLRGSHSTGMLLKI